MHLAKKTLQAINAALEADGGAKYRGLLRRLMPQADDAYREDEEDFRDHLGASLIGQECTRAAWYGWRWVARKKIPAALIRLFNRGHLEEPRLIALLMLIGCQVWHKDVDGKQFRMKKGYKGHQGGGCDGVAAGIPDLPNIPVLTEYKTHNLKNFAKLQERGVLSSHWKHFVQMQQYMGEFELTHALYVGSCKDNDELHLEIVQYDPTQNRRYNERARLIIDSPEAPPRLQNASPAWWGCKFCDFKGVCHSNEPVLRNCRTCSWVAPVENGKWICTHHKNLTEGVCPEIPSDFQRISCDHYELNPSIKK